MRCWNCGSEPAIGCCEYGADLTPSVNVMTEIPWLVFRATRILMLEAEQATQMHAMVDPLDEAEQAELAADIRHIEADMRALHGEWVVS